MITNKNQDLVIIPKGELLEALEEMLVKHLSNQKNGQTQNNKPNVLGDYVSENEAQKLLNRKSTWFFNKRRSGELVGKKAGNQWWYKLSDLEIFISR